MTNAQCVPSIFNAHKLYETHDRQMRDTCRKKKDRNKDGDRANVFNAKAVVSCRNNIRKSLEDLMYINKYDLGDKEDYEAEEKALGSIETDETTI